MWIYGSGLAVIFDLEDEQTYIRRDESSLPMQTVCFISASAQRPSGARSGSRCDRHRILKQRLLLKILICNYSFGGTIGLAVYLLCLDVEAVYNEGSLLYFCMLLWVNPVECRSLRSPSMWHPVRSIDHVIVFNVTLKTD